MKYSVVIPFYNEENNVIPLFDQLLSALEKLSAEFEILFINDGSKDSTLQKIKSIQCNNLKLVDNKSRIGQGLSLLRGIQFAQHNNIITLDGDLQNDPEDIKLLLNEYENGNDLVIGFRENRKDSFFKKIQSKLGNRVVKCFFRYPNQDIGCGLKVFKKKPTVEMSFSKNFHRYIAILFYIHGYKVSEVKINHRERNTGKSKYGLKRFYNFFYELMLLYFYKLRLDSPITN